MSQLLHRTRTYASFSLLFLILPLLLLFAFAFFTNLIYEGFSFGKLIGVIISSACCYGLIETFFHDFKVIEFYTDKLVIYKPLKRIGVFRKGRNEWILLSSEWDEAYHFSRKYGSTIYFRKNKTAIFVLSYDNGGFIIDKFQRYFSEKKIEVHADRNNEIDLQRYFPTKSIKELKKNFPDRYVN
ncbi:MAG: hypothetical protein ACK46Y_03370 [Fluviicola sp.]